MNQKSDLVLISDSIFTAASSTYQSGYVAIKGDRILAVGKGKVPADLLDVDTEVINLGEKTISPGFIDVHCFFSGYVIRYLGVDLSGCRDEIEVFNILNKMKERPIFGHGMKFHISTSMLDVRYPDTPIVLFLEGCETCAMNTAAIHRFGFSPDRCYPEAYVKIFPYVLGNKKFIIPQFIEYMKMMNSRGVTSVKEMGFDDFYSFTDTLAELEKEKKLTMRVNFMSQPVDKDIDFTYGETMRNKFKGEFVTFSGYNQMTDGSVSEYNAELKKPYNDRNFCCQMNIDWDKLGKDTREADKRGFRFSLHAQGDGAVSKTVDIFDTCKKDENGKLVNRHAITDLEFTDPADLERMGKLGVIAEIYPQIQSLAERKNKIEMINEKIGEERGQYYWNRRKMADSNVTISCGTDLPLLIDDIPESVYHAVGGYFADGGEPFNKQNTLSIYELMRAWTIGGAYNLSKEDQLGSLEPGKKADLTVLSTNIFRTPVNEVKNVKVEMTIVNGKIVYREGE